MCSGIRLRRDVFGACEHCNIASINTVGRPSLLSAALCWCSVSRLECFGKVGIMGPEKYEVDEIAFVMPGFCGVGFLTRVW